VLLHRSNPHGLFVWLDYRATDPHVVGGKGASLARLHALGAPVPVAGALTTAAYATFATSIGLRQRAADVTIADVPHVHHAIMTTPLPDAVEAALADVYLAFHTRFGANLALAVRSSAAAEDGLAHSFAGLHDTILDVRTPAALEAAIRQCWASLWSERAVSYRLAHGLDGEGPAIAVVVQHLVRSDVSFVVFTTDPVSGNADHLVISAAWGLGEAIVSGIVTPDHVVVGPDGQVRSYTVGSKERMVIPGGTPGAGTREVAVPRALQAMPALSHEQAVGIAKIARDLSHRLGYAADLEGGIERGAISLFQARPITTLGQRAALAPS